MTATVANLNILPAHRIEIRGIDTRSGPWIERLRREINSDASRTPDETIDATTKNVTREQVDG